MIVLWSFYDTFFKNHLQKRTLLPEFANVWERHMDRDFETKHTLILTWKTQYSLQILGYYEISHDFLYWRTTLQ